MVKQTRIMLITPDIAANITEPRQWQSEREGILGGVSDPASKHTQFANSRNKQSVRLLVYDRGL